MEEIYFTDNIRYPLGTFEREPSTLYVTFTNDLCLFWRIKSIYSSVFKLRGGCSPAIPSPQVLLCHTTRKANMDEYRIYMADKEARKTHHYISSVIASETEVVLDMIYFEHFYMIAFLCNMSNIIIVVRNIIECLVINNYPPYVPNVLSKNMMCNQRIFYWFISVCKHFIYLDILRLN